mmetsp:Transcript_67998/g.116847  ORF Transcript_67998/g.116847 Transcript_67998/m.116847 type:complete len:214 (-) Transcript_67998:199-840(-)
MGMLARWRCGWTSGSIGGGVVLQGLTLARHIPTTLVFLGLNRRRFTKQFSPISRQWFSSSSSAVQMSKSGTEIGTPPSYSQPHLAMIASRRFFSATGQTPTLWLPMAEQLSTKRRCLTTQMLRAYWWTATLYSSRGWTPSGKRPLTAQNSPTLSGASAFSPAPNQGVRLGRWEHGTTSKPAEWPLCGVTLKIVPERQPQNSQKRIDGGVREWI